MDDLSFLDDALPKPKAPKSDLSFLDSALPKNDLSFLDSALPQPFAPNASVDNILGKMRGSVMTQESGGNQTVRNNRTSATGLFQVMPANIPVWTKKYYNKSLTQDQFANDRNAQEAVFKGEMGKYVNKALQLSGGDEDKAIRMAAAAWYGGEGNMKNYDADFGGKGNEPTFRQYTTSILNRIKKGGVPSLAPQANPLVEQGVIQPTVYSPTPEQTLTPIDERQWDELPDGTAIAPPSVTSPNTIQPDILETTASVLSRPQGTEADVSSPADVQTKYAEWLKTNGLQDDDNNRESFNVAQQAEVDKQNFDASEVDRQRFNASLDKPVVRTTQPIAQKQGQPTAQTTQATTPKTAPQGDLNPDGGLTVEIDYRQASPNESRTNYAADLVARAITNKTGIPFERAKQLFLANPTRKVEGGTMTEDDRKGTLTETFTLGGDALAKYYKANFNVDETVKTAKDKAIADAQANEIATRDELINAAMPAQGEMSITDPNAWKLAFRSLLSGDLTKTSATEDEVRGLVTQDIDEAIKAAGSAAEAKAIQEQFKEMGYGEKAIRSIGLLKNTINKFPANFAKTLAWAEDTASYLDEQLGGTGAVRLPSITPTDVVNAYDWVQSKITGLPYKANKAGDVPMLIARAIEKAFPDDPKIAQTALGKFTKATGSALPFLAGAIATGGSSAITALMGIGSQVGEMYDDPELNREQRLLAGLTGVPIGASELLGLKFAKLGNIINAGSNGKFATSFLSWLKETGKEATEETIQEFFQSASSDIVKQALKDNGFDRQKIADSLGGAVGDAATGGIVGALFGGGVPLAVKASSKIEQKEPQTSPIPVIEPTAKVEPTKEKIVAKPNAQTKTEVQPQPTPKDETLVEKSDDVEVQAEAKVEPEKVAETAPKTKFKEGKPKEVVAEGETEYSGVDDFFVEKAVPAEDKDGTVPALKGTPDVPSRGLRKKPVEKAVDKVAEEVAEPTQTETLTEQGFNELGYSLPSGLQNRGVETLTPKGNDRFDVKLKNGTVLSDVLIRKQLKSESVDNKALLTPSAKIQIAYNGKMQEVDSDFKSASMRVNGNLRAGETGYVKDVDGKIYEISTSSKKAKLMPDTLATPAPTKTPVAQRMDGVKALETERAEAIAEINEEVASLEAQGEVLKARDLKATIAPLSKDFTKRIAEAKKAEAPAVVKTETPAPKAGDTVENILGGWKGTLVEIDGELMVKRGKEVYGEYIPRNYTNRAVSDLDEAQADFANARKLPTKSLATDTNFAKNTRIVDDGVIAVDEIPEIELIRRVLDSPTQFYGAMTEPSQVKGVIDKLDKMIAFTTEPKVKANLGKLKNLVKRASQRDGTVIFAMSEESLPEEKAHRALYGVRGDTERAHQIAPDVMKSIQEAPVFQNAKKFQDAYGKVNPETKVEEFAVKASLGQWNDLGITSDTDKFEAMSLADDFYRSFAEVNKGKLTTEQIIDKLSTEIAYAQEYQNQKASRNEKEDTGADESVLVEPAKRKASGTDAKASGTSKPDGLESPKLESREPSKSGVEFDTDKAQEAKEKGMKVAAMSRHLGVEQYYTPESLGESELKAVQLVGRIGLGAAIDQALYGKPSPEAFAVLNHEMQRLRAVAQAQKELGNDAEYAATMERYSDLIAGATMRQISTGREVNSYKMLAPLGADAAQMVATKLRKLAFGDDATLTPKQVEKIQQLAKELESAYKEVEKSKIIIAEQQKIIDSGGEAKPRPVLNRQEALLDNYKKKEKKILADLATKFPNSPMFKGDSNLAMMAVGRPDVILDPETEALLKDYTIGQVLTNKSYATVLSEIQDISGASETQAKDIHAMAMDEIRGASKPVSEEAKKRIQIRQEHYSEADAHAHPEKAAAQAVKLAEGSLKRQIERLEKEIATGEKEVKTQGKVTSPEIQRLKKERDALKTTRDALLGTGLTDQQKIDRSIKAARKSIDNLTKKITENDLAVVRKQPSLTSDKLTALREEQKTLRGILKDVRKEAKKVQSAPTSKLSRIAQQAVEFYPDDVELIGAIDRLTGKESRNINDVINDLQRDFGFHITEAKEIAQKAQEAIKRIKESNRKAVDEAKGIQDAERIKLNEKQAKATKDAQNLNTFLKQQGENPNAMKRFNNDFRAKLVSNYGTQIFNAIQAMTVSTPAEALLDLFEAGLRTFINIGESSNIRAIDVILPYSYIFANNRQIAENALSQFPEEYYKVHSGLLGDIDIEPLQLADTKTGVMKSVHKWFDLNEKLNDKLAHLTGAKLQEMHFRNATIAANFDQVIRSKTKGKMNLQKAMADGTLTDYITETDAKRAADRALRVTMASQIDDPLGIQLKRGYDWLDNYVPVLLNPVTFARFTYTATKVMVANPLLFGAMDSSKLGGEGYSTRSIAKGVLAWSTVAIAYGLMSALGGDDDKWYTLYPMGKDGVVLDIRRTYPLAAFFYMAHLIKETGEGRPRPSLSEFLGGFASLETEYFQYGAPMELLGNTFDSTKSWDDVGSSSARVLGGYFAGWLRFFKPMRDTLAQFDAEERAYREDPETAKDKFINEISRTLPVSRLSGQKKKLGIDGKPIEQKFPIGRIFGVNIANPAMAKNKDSVATDWANTLFPFSGAGGQMTPEQRKLASARSMIKEAKRRGETINVEQALKNMDATLSKESLGRLKDELKYSELGAKIKYNFGDNEKDIKALQKVWGYATPSEKVEITKVLREKKNVSQRTKGLFK